MSFHGPLLGAPIQNILVASGVVFLIVAIVGEVPGRFSAGKNGRIAAGIVGPLLLITGLLIVPGPADPPPETQTPTPEPEGFRVVETDINAFADNMPWDHSKGLYDAKCPVRVKFRGTISAIGGDGRVTYRWILYVRNGENISNEIRTLKFETPSTEFVWLNYTIGDLPETVTPTHPRTGASRTYVLEILEPDRLRTEPLRIDVQCEFE